MTIHPGTRALDRGLALLDCFRPGTGALHHHELVERTGLPKATVSRLIATLLRRGYLVHDHAGMGYRLGAPLLSLARTMQIDEEGLITHLEPAIKSTAQRLGVVVGFGTLHDGEVVYLVVSNRDETRSFQRVGPGMRVPMLGTGVGIACVAACSASEREQVTARLRALSSWTSGSDGLINRAARQIADRGYCTITYRDGRNASVAAPVVLQGGHIYGFTISYPLAARSTSVPSKMTDALQALLDRIPAAWRDGVTVR